jgi:hypothetical protein
MLIRMRTTLVIDDSVLRRAKEQAARRGVTLGQFVTEALRSLLAARPAAQRRFKMATYGGSSGSVRHEPADFAEELEHDDRAVVGR